jgi:hypothetical protein
MKKLIKLSIVAVTGFVLLYISRFWLFTLWDRPGLFDIKAIPPQGGLLRTWLRGTDLVPFELMIWAIGGFLVLTGLEKIFDKLKTPSD